MFLEHPQISFTLVAFFFSAFFQFSIYILHVSSNHFTGISSHWSNSQFNFFSFPDNTVFPIVPSVVFLIFSSQMTIAILESWLLHSPDTWDVSKGCHKFLFTWICNFFLIPSAKPFSWAYFCLAYRDPLWPTQLRTIVSCNPPSTEVDLLLLH